MQKAAQAETPKGTDSWLLADVLERFPDVQALAWDCGYFASLFGSVVNRGAGRDLDILLTPFRDYRQDQARFLSEFGGEEEKRNVNPAHGILSYEISKGGLIYHFVFGSVGDKPAR